MVALNFNAQNIAPAEAGLPVWEGIVPVTISRCEVANTSANNGNKFLAVYLRAAMGKYAGQENVVRLNLWNSSPQATDIAQRELSSISHVTGRMQLNDSNDLVGANMLTIWEKGTREIQNQQTGKTTHVDSCECKEYRITDGRTIKELRGGMPPSTPFDPAAYMAGQNAAPAAPPPQPAQQSQAFAPPAAAPAQPVSPQQMQGGAAQPGFTPPAAPAIGTAGPAMGGGFAPAPGGAPSPAAGGFGTAAGPGPSNGGFSPPAGPAGGGFASPGAAPAAPGGFGGPAPAQPQGGGFGAPAAGGFQPQPGGAGPWAQR